MNLERGDMDTKQRLIDVIRKRFNAGVTYKGRILKWDAVIEQKAMELSRFLAGKPKTISFEEPVPELHRSDNRELRNRILGLTQDSARALGIGKSTLHHLRLNSRRDAQFTIYSKVREKLETH
jgi:CRISP-associated protein Cas1